jgi:glycerophosphoryl diester phosphodiesterase
VVLVQVCNNEVSHVVLANSLLFSEGRRTPVDGHIRSHIKENTLLSFNTAFHLGAQIVEFDVHLTSDLVPVIYHDFTIHLPSSGGIKIPIHSMTLEQFKKIGGRTINRAQSTPALRNASKENEPILDAFPTLKELLLNTPKELALNVEIKYPMDDEKQRENVSPVDRNTYLECILWDVYEYAKDRTIMYSSFDPDILQYKTVNPRHCTFNNRRI